MREYKASIEKMKNKENKARNDGKRVEGKGVS